MTSRFVTVKISAEDNGIRLDRWFKRYLKHVPFGIVVKSIRKGSIRLNGNKADISTRVAKNDVLIHPLFNSIEAAEPITEKRDVPKKVVENIRKTVLFMDENILVINKPEGLAVQGGTKIAYSLDDIAEHLKFDYEDKPKLVHRLDKETSGIVIMARKASTAADLSELFRKKDMNKQYLALCHGTPRPNTGKIDIPLEKILTGDFEKMESSEKGKRAVTLYKVLDNAADKVSLLELDLITGRTHQIRAHLAYIKTPIIGDGKYGDKALRFNKFNNKLFLHAYSVNFKLGNKDYSFKAPLPKHFLEAMEFFGLEFYEETDIRNK